MKDLELDGSGDLVVEDNNLAKISDVDELRQRILLTLKINKGEWFLNQNLGVPWIETLREPDAKDKIQREVAKVLTSFDEVQEITRLETEYSGEDRKLELEFELATDLGNMQFEEVV